LNPVAEALSADSRSVYRPTRIPWPVTAATGALPQQPLGRAVLVPIAVLAGVAITGLVRGSGLA
jgi:hypothetical protein